nr:hypothetical protein [Tanacetum cinerariifolium]
MVAYLTKSNASEGFNLIIDFLHGRSIKYALIVNLNIYVLCIKQFWTTVAVKKVNDVIRLQALVDKKKMVITEATIREALRLDDAEGVECLSNDKVFAELARIGYEKPSTKLTFYKAFFLSQWKFPIHTILQCMSAKRTSWNEFSSSMASAVICLSLGRNFNFSKKEVGDLSTHTTKYTSPALTHKVFANMRRVGKGFSRVETPLFEGMLVAHEVAEEGDAEVHVEEVNAGDTAKGDVSGAHDEVPTVDEEPSIPSLTPPTLPPQPSHDIPLTSQVQPTPPQSPQVQPQSPQPQPQPQQDAGIPMNLLQEVMDTCTALSRRVKHLELDKIAQALEITKLKRRVKKLERRNEVKVLKLRRFQKVGTTQRVETSDETVMDDVSNQGRMIAEMDQDAGVVLKDDKEIANEAKEVAEDAKVDESVDIQGRKAESKAEIYKIDLDHANKVLSMQEDKSEPAEVQEVVDVVTTAKINTEVQEVVDVVTTAKIITEVVTASSETIIAASTIITAAEAQVFAVILTVAPARVTDAPSRRRKGVDKGKGILVEEPKPLKKQQQIEQDEKYARELEAELNKNIDWDEVIDHVKMKAKEDHAVKKYQALKRKPQTEAQARENMMLYLKNVAGFKMDYFKGMSYDDIQERRALKRLNETPVEKAGKRRKLDEEVEELKRHLQIVPNEDDDVYTEATPLARKVPVVDYEIIEMNNKPYYKIIRADDTHQLYVSFLTLLRNFDREDLEALWSLVKERFSTTKPKNFSDDFLLMTLGAMFEKPYIHTQVWKNQISVHGPAKFKGWKLLESCGVQIITFTTTQLILLVERKYPLTRFTLDQMLNAVRLEVEEESEVSLELLSFGVDAAQGTQEKHAKCLMLLVKDLVLLSQLMLLINAAETS